MDATMERAKAAMISEDEAKEIGRNALHAAREYAAREYAAREYAAREYGAAKCGAECVDAIRALPLDAPGGGS